MTRPDVEAIEIAAYTGSSEHNPEQDVRALCQWVTHLEDALADLRAVADYRSEPPEIPADVRETSYRRGWAAAMGTVRAALAAAPSGEPNTEENR